MRDPYAVRDPYMQTLNSYYSYKNAYTNTPAFAYIKNTRTQHIDYSKEEALIGLGASAAGFGLTTGKISASVVGSKLVAAGILTGVSGGMIPVIGAIATIGAGAAGAVAGYKALTKGAEGLAYLGEKAFIAGGKLSTAAAKILGKGMLNATKASHKLAKKLTNDFLNKSKTAISKNMQIPESLLAKNVENKKIEQMYSNRLDTLQKAIRQGKDVKEDLKDILQYRAPNQTMLNKLSNTIALNFIKQSALKNNNTVNLRQTKKEFTKFAKEVGLNKKEINFFKNNFDKQLESLKDNLIVTKDNKILPFKQLETSVKNKVKQTQNNFEKNFSKKGEKEQGKLELGQQKEKEHENTSFGR